MIRDATVWLMSKAVTGPGSSLASYLLSASFHCRMPDKSAVFAPFRQFLQPVSRIHSAAADKRATG